MVLIVLRPARNKCSRQAAKARRCKLRSGCPCTLALNLKRKLCKRWAFGYLAAMSTVQEIEAAIPRLSRAEIEEIRAWIDDFLENQLELTDEVKARLDESRRGIYKRS